MNLSILKENLIKKMIDLVTKVTTEEELKPIQEFMRNYNQKESITASVEAVDGENFSRLQSKNLLVKYEELDFSDVDTFSTVKSVMDKIFKDGNIEYIGNGEFTVKLKKCKDIKNLNQFMILGRKPQIRTLNLSNFDGIVFRNTSKIISSFESFLTMPSSELCRVLEYEIEHLLKQIKMQIHSEYLLSAILLQQLFNVGIKTQWKDFTIYSIDSKMEYELIDMKNKPMTHNIRCDIILLYKNNLFIFENKYRYNRSNSQASLALKSIEDRGYPEIVTKYLQTHYENLVEPIQNIISVGVGYSIFHDKIKCEMLFKSKPIAAMDGIKPRQKRKTK